MFEGPLENFLKDAFPSTHTVGTWALRSRGYCIQSCPVSGVGAAFILWIFNWKIKLAESKNMCIGWWRADHPLERWGRLAWLWNLPTSRGPPRSLSTLSSKDQISEQRGKYQPWGVGQPEARYQTQLPLVSHTEIPGTQQGLNKA